MENTSIEILKNLGSGVKGCYFQSRRVPLHIMITSFGRSTIYNDYSFKGRKRGSQEFAVFQITLEGYGALEIDGTKSFIQPGSAMLVHIPGDHHYYLPKNSPYWSFFYICINGSEALRLIQNIIKESGSIIHLGKNNSIYERCFKLYSRYFKQEIRNPTEEDDETALHLSQVAYTIILDLLKITKYKGLVNKPVQPRFIDDARVYIEKSYQKNICIDDIAGAVGLSKSHFSREFQLWRGESPRKHLENYRIRRAATLLYSGNGNSSDGTIKKIAFECGYQDVNYFCKVFRKRMGMSPAEYRKSSI
jgi:AraC-like DNA-binding protein